MITPLEVEQIILAALPDSTVEVRDMTGTSDHFDILVVSKVFAGKPLMEQHKIIFAILDKEMKDRIHAVQIKTKVPKND